MSVNPSALAPLVSRLNHTHAKIKGTPLPLPSSSDLDSLVSSIELLAASLTGANAADLAKLTSRLEDALAKIGTKLPPAGAPLNSVESVTARLEQLAAAATGAPHKAPAAAPAAASHAAAAPAAAAAPKVDVAAAKAKADAEAKAKSEAEAAAKKKKDEEEKKAKEEAEKKAKAAHAVAAKPAPAAAPAAAKPAPAAAATAPAAASKPAAAASSAAASANGPAASGPFFSLDQLKGPASAVPAGVNYATRELWLSDAEFLKALKVSKAEWSKLPAWKKEQAKKTVGLF